MNIASTTPRLQKFQLHSTAKPQTKEQAGPPDSVDLNPVRSGLFRTMDSLDALAKTRMMGQGLLRGSLHAEDLQSIKSPSRVLKAAGNAATGPAKPLFDLVNEWSASEDHITPISKFEDMLTKEYGMEETGRGQVSVNYRNDFQINTNFLGSRSVVSQGETKLGSVKVLQSPGAAPDGPAAIVVKYNRPAFVGASLEGTNLKHATGFRSLYFVTDATKVNRATESTCGDDAAAKNHMETLLKSLEKEAAVELHSYTRNNGSIRVYDDSQLNVGDEVVTPGANFRHAVAAACDHAINETLGIELPKEQASEQLSGSPFSRLARAARGTLLA